MVSHSITKILLVKVQVSVNESKTPMCLFTIRSSTLQGKYILFSNISSSAIYPLQQYMLKQR
jgi:hypothetical protein